MYVLNSWFMTDPEFVRYKYVGGNTKAEIMKDLAKRVTTSGDDARVLAELSAVWSNVVAQILLALRESDNIKLSMDAPLVNILLESQDGQLLRRIFRMLIDMSERSGIPAYIRNSPPSAKLVSLISHADHQIVWGALEALAVCCFHCHNGIQTAVAAGLIDKLLSCTALWGTKRFPRMLEYYLGPTFVDLIPHLLSPLRSPDFNATSLPETVYVRAGTEQERALLYMLSFFIKNAEGAQVFAQAAMDEDMWEIVDMLLDFPNPGVRKSVCFMLGHLAQNASDMPRFVLGFVPVVSEMFTALDLLPALLDCPCSEVRNAACQTLGPQAVYESLPPTILTPQIYQRILSSLLQEDNELIASLIHDLPSITSPRSPVALGSLGILSILSRSPNNRVSKWAGDLLEHLDGTGVPGGRHCADSGSDTRNQASFPFSGVEANIVESAMETLLSVMLWSPMGVNAEILEGVLGLIASHNNQLNNGARKILRWMALQESTLLNAFPTRLCEQLVRLLGDDDTAIVATAVYVLSLITKRSHGAKTLVDDITAATVIQLLNSPDPQVRRWTCDMLGNLVQHSATSMAVVQAIPRQTLEALLRGQDEDVVSSALYALNAITQCNKNAQAVLSRPILAERGSTSVQWLNPDVQQATRYINSIVNPPKLKPVDVEVHRVVNIALVDSGSFSVLKCKE
ncbi:armadillo-type protein [Mycena polygramma]|nr:armadillo-type protein [Mycena polygramma]